MVNNIQDLINGNREWVKEVLEKDPQFFDRLADGQSPQFLWIGCSDSRVPATEITKTQPGSIFVHRNIANVVVHTDANLLSVAYYAVMVLKIKHIIVCGHYGCGGILASMSNTYHGFIDNWLTHIKDVYRLHHKELDAIKEPELKADRLVELNVIEQVYNLSKVNFIQKKWDLGEELHIHGWVYKVNDGLIKDLNVTVSSPHGMNPVFNMD
jgi:carbonic anhydrase